MPDRKDRSRVRDLAKRIAEIAALPVQEEKRALWRKLNALKPERPMVLIDQVCWSEFDGREEELVPACEDPACREYETALRRRLYQWKRFPADQVVGATLGVPLAVHGTRFGIRVREKTLATDPASRIVSHRYENQFVSEADLEKIRAPEVRHDAVETERRLAFAHDLFDGLLETRPAGVNPYVSLWDPVSMWMGVENALLAMIDRPDYLHRLLARMTDGYLQILDQLEAQGLLCGPQDLIHCSGAFTDELPAPGYDPARPRTRDIWMYGLAQMLSTVSPDRFDEFEAAYTSRLCARFGLVYYGCCEPLDGRMDRVRRLPRVRKVSMSPWTDPERGAEGIGGDFVFSSKPNPAHLAGERFRPESARGELAEIRRACEAHGCPLEFILKDISTVRGEPGRLAEWARIAMREVGA